MKAPDPQPAPSTGIVWWPFGLSGHLKRAEKAFARQEFSKAQPLLESCWEALKSRRAQNEPSPEVERRVLLCLVQALAQKKDGDAVVQWCRTARGLGFEDACFLELACLHHVESQALLDEQSMQELVAWACSPETSQSAVDAQAVESLLRRDLSPASTTPKGTPEAIAALRAHAFRWSWPHLYHAELARQREAWHEAASALQDAVVCELASETRQQWLWAQARCWVLAGDMKRAGQALQGALELGEPISHEQWALAARIFAAVDPHGRGLGTAVAAVKAFCDSEELVCLLWSLCDRTQQWEQARPVAEQVLKAGSGNGRVVAAGFACAAAVALRDEALALKAAQVVMREPELFGERYEGLKVLAAAVFSGRDSGGARELDRVATAQATPDTRYRLNLLREWTALGRGGRALRASARTDASGSASLGRHWANLELVISLWADIEAGAVQEVAARVEKLGRSALPPETMAAICAAGAWKALAIGEEETAAGLAALSPEASLREQIAKRVLLRARKQWQRASDASEAPMEKAERVLQRIGIAERLDVQVPADLTQWWAAVELVAKTTDPAACRAPLILPPESASAEEWGLGAYVAARRQVSGWEHWVESAHARLRGHGLKPVIAHYLARAKAEQGQWSKVATLLQAPEANRSELVARLGAPPWLVKWHGTWEAFEQGRFREAALAAVEAAHVHPGGCPVELARLLLAALAAAFCQNPAGLRPTVERAAPHLARCAANPQNAARLSWAEAGRLGIWGAAERILFHGLQREPSCTTSLHAFGLASLCCAAASARQGRPSRAARYLLQGLGAWTALSRLDEPLVQYAFARFSVYGHKDERTSANRLRDAMERWLAEFCQRHAESCGLDRKKLDLLQEIEKRGARAVREAGGLSPPGGNGSSLNVGPLLAVSLGWQSSVQALLGHEGLSSAADDPGEALIRRLEALVGLKPSANKKSKREPDNGSRELTCLFSPLAAVLTLIELEQFEEAATAAAAFLQVGDDAQPLPDVADEMLAGLVDERMRGRLEEEARALFMESHVAHAKRIVGHVPLDIRAARRVWSGALEAASRIGRDEAMRKALAEVAVGRSKALAEVRTKQQRQQDALDRRSNRARELEALDLLRMAWDLTRHPLVQGVLTSHLNVRAVKLANKGLAHEEVYELLFEALTVNPKARTVCNNIVALTTNRVGEQLTADPEAAANEVVTVRRRLQALIGTLAKSDTDELRRCLQELGEKASTPFFNSSHHALDESDWQRATEMMLLAFRVGPDDNDVKEGIQWLQTRLAAQASQGDPQAAECAERLEQETGIAPALPGQLGRLLQGLQQRQPRVSNTEAEELNRRGVRAAKEGRFVEAMELLTQARQMDPQSSLIRRNYENVAKAWLMRQLKEGPGRG